MRIFREVIHYEYLHDTCEGQSPHGSKCIVYYYVGYAAEMYLSHWQKKV